MASRVATFQSRKVDKEKLYKQFVKRGVTAEEVSTSLGRNNYYISNTISKYGSVLPEYVIIGIKNMYNIEPETYCIDEEETPAVNSIEIDYDRLEQMIKDNTIQLDYKELYKAIYSAVYQAMHKALNEPGDSKESN